MLIAFDVIFTRVLALNMPLTKIGLGFAAVMVCGMLYGPGWAALCAGLGDLSVRFCSRRGRISPASPSRPPSAARSSARRCIKSV